mmetsp:Transcript_3198/g.9757  ORF Transcript_3198/g.9757 Transcript_3198/m.9757 type:complete len:254 (+) Transcript_3198:3-764(+)
MAQQGRQADWAARHFGVARQAAVKKACAESPPHSSTSWKAGKSAGAATVRGSTRSNLEGDRCVEPRAEVDHGIPPAIAALIPSPRRRRAKERSAPPPPRRPSFQRPSLASQLAKICDQANDVTSSLVSSFGIDKASGLLLQIPANSFVVGKLASRFPSPVEFFSDRCEYTFYHPFQSTMIRMVMYYADMVSPVLCLGHRTLDFRIARDLLHYGSDYNPRDATHSVSVEFSSEQGVRSIGEILRPLLHTLRISR